MTIGLDLKAAADERAKMKTEGLKFDAGKTRYDLVPADGLDLIAQVLTFGAKKYGDRNWENGMAFGRLFGASMRHCWAWFRGEQNDPESGLPHLAHAATCLLMLLSFTQRASTDPKWDDRAPLTPKAS